MNIGLIGYYGYEAYSDEFILKAIQNAFNEEADIKWSIIQIGNPVYPKNLDLIIIGGGSLLGAPFHGLKTYLETREIPLVIFGTGVRELKDETMGELQYLWNKASLIGVRGATSVERLEKRGFDTSKISLYGDPIFLLKNEHQNKDNYIKGVIRPSPTTQNNITWMKDSFNILCKKTQRDSRIIPFSLPQGDHGVKLGLEQTYQEVCSASFWFGNRLHPFCIALINDIPSIAVEIEFRKVEDVCSTINYPYWIKLGDNVVEIYDVLIRNWNHDREKLKFQIDRVRTGLKKMVKETLSL